MRFDEAIKEGLQIGIGADRIRERMERVLDKKEIREKGAWNMIQAVQLTKRFEDILAVDHIDAVIQEGSVFGLIGTNGAGKSTFLRLASGILKPDEGRSPSTVRRSMKIQRQRRNSFISLMRCISSATLRPLI